ncbi:MAG TPA: gephyrin-like molybdotransferase receptor GlpR [Nakamurella sp.]
MSIPTSLIVVLLVVAWLVVLVPMIAKRRDKVPQSQSGGNGFRVLRRAQATLRRRPNRTAKADAPEAAEPGEEPTTRREHTLVSVGSHTPDEPLDAADEWAAANAGRPSTPRPRPAEYADRAALDQPEPQWAEPTPEPGTERDTEYLEAYVEPGADTTQGAPWAEPPAAHAPESVTAFPSAPNIPAEVDEQEWVEHAAAASAPRHRTEVDDEALRPTPRRRGRGGYDPEAAEATRAYKYRQRRRVTLVLAAATVLFTATAFLLANWLWVGAVVSLTLLVLYLAYLRRQVKIEAQIRQRRMERLQRARQIRPEYGRGRPPVRAGRSAAGPGRTVVDLDDDDPSFDHLEPYDPPVTYRRAAGQ